MLTWIRAAWHAAKDIWGAGEGGGEFPACCLEHPWPILRETIKVDAPEKVKTFDEALLDDAAEQVPLAIEMRDRQRQAQEFREANQGRAALAAVVSAYAGELMQHVGMLIQEAAAQELAKLEDVEVGPELDRPAALALASWAEGKLEERGYEVQFGVPYPGEVARLELTISWED
jgi:hypothetical protein